MFLEWLRKEGDTLRSAKTEPCGAWTLPSQLLRSELRGRDALAEGMFFVTDIRRTPPTITIRLVC